MRSGLLILLFILLEISSFIFMAVLVGVFQTLLLVILSMGIGFIIFRMLGEQMGMAQIRAMRTGQLQTDFDMSKLYLFLVAILFMIPGFFSDLLALLLLIPQVRSWCAQKVQMKAHGFQPQATNDGHVTIDGECEEVGKDELPKSD
jgi:UPF0716 protein FxsA